MNYNRFAKTPGLQTGDEGEGRFQASAVIRGEALESLVEKTTDFQSAEAYKYQQAVVGGSFDLLHIGHKDLLNKAFETSEFVIIGLTTDDFNKKRRKETFEDQDLRKKNLQAFLDTKKYQDRAKIFSINDIYGQSITDPKLEAIFVTLDTRQNAKLINFKRIESGLAPLLIVKIPLVKDEDGKAVSSSRIRDGEISSDGLNYKNFLLSQADKKLSEGVRDKLKEPLGQIIKLSDLTPPVVTVGDITTQKALSMNIKPKISVVDLKVKRQEVFRNLKEIGFVSDRADFEVINPPGEISKSLILAVEKALKNQRENQVILVKGEEDLAAIPAILLSPLGAKVLYGQPDRGVVEVLVNQEMKDKICQILQMLK